MAAQPEVTAQGWAEDFCCGLRYAGRVGEEPYWPTYCQKCGWPVMTVTRLGAQT